MTKTCRSCGATKSVSAFRPQKRNRDGFSSWCAECHNEANRAFRAQGAYHKHKDRARFRRYGITPEQFEALREAQGGGCAICGTADVELQVDHCHESQGVRGLLCINCNQGLGQFSDDPDRLTAAAAYLIRTPAADAFEAPIQPV